MHVGYLLFLSRTIWQSQSIKFQFEIIRELFCHHNVRLPVHCLVTADYQFAIVCEILCQCHISGYLFFICELLLLQQPVCVTLSLPWRW